MVMTLTGPRASKSGDQIYAGHFRLASTYYHCGMYLYLLPAFDYHTGLADYPDVYAFGGYCTASSELSSTQTVSRSILNIFTS
jgi:hypothetical protein